jgi:hypothetical protein
MREQLKWHDEIRAAGVDQIGVGLDLAKAPGPVVTAASEHLERVIVDVQLDAISVEFDLMDPAIAGRHFVNRCCQRRLDESREGRFPADCCRLLALKRHGTNSTQKIEANVRPEWWAGSAPEHSEASKNLPALPDVKQREDERGGQ